MESELESRRQQRREHLARKTELTERLMRRKHAEPVQCKTRTDAFKEYLDSC